MKTILFRKILSQTPILTPEYKKNLLLEAGDFSLSELDILAEGIYEEEEKKLIVDKTIIFPEFQSLSIKTPEQIENIRKSGTYLNNLLALLEKAAKPRIQLHELDKIAEEYLAQQNIQSSFKGFEWYAYNICTCVNNCLSHGISDEYLLRDGDIITIDAGVNYKGAITDAAISCLIGEKEKNLRGYALVETARRWLYDSLRYLWPKKNGYDFAFHLHNYYLNAGYKVIKNCSGHGVGNLLHEAPNIYHWPNCYMKNIIFEPGMVFAIEPLITEKTTFVQYPYNNNVWYSKEGDFWAYFECTILITETGYEILAWFPYQEWNSWENFMEFSKTALLKIKDAVYTVDIADNELLHKKWLMFRDVLPVGSGMLFMFKENAKHPFWTKDTFVSLDILWIDENFQIVHIQTDTAIDDFSGDNYSFIPDRDARYVLEICAGEVEKIQMKIGDYVIIENL